MIGQRTISSFVRAMRCKKRERERKKREKDIRGAQSTSKRWKHPGSFQSAAILRRNLCPLCLSVFQFSQKRLETRTQLIIITIFFFFFFCVWTRIKRASINYLSFSLLLFLLKIDRSVFVHFNAKNLYYLKFAPSITNLGIILNPVLIRTISLAR